MPTPAMQLLLCPIFIFSTTAQCLIDSLHDFMKRGFYTIMGAQFFSSLADNALFVAAVELIRISGGEEWQRAALVPMFALFYVVLAPFVGAFADSKPKGQVMFVSNAIKVVGCLMMLWHTPFAGLCHRGLRRCGLLSCEIRHLDRIAARLAIGQSQWLDRRLDHRVHHLGCFDWWAIGRPPCR